MILPDVNILIQAFREGLPEHPVYGGWLTLTIIDGTTLLLPDAVISGFLRIVTSPRVFD